MDLRKLDALVAEHVFGQKMTHNQNAFDQTGSMPVKYYSTEIAAAWDVVHKLGFDEWRWNGAMGTIDGIERYHWWFQAEGQHFGANASSAPIAICLAALKSKNIDVSEWEG